MGKIYWLASYPKSGNTWLRIFLNNYWCQAETPVDINTLRDVPNAASRTIFENLTGLEASDLTADEVDALRPLVYQRWTTLQPAPVFAKVHDAYTHVPTGAALFPAAVTAGAIYLIRNPLDVALSFAAHNGQPVEQTITQMANEQFVLGYHRCTLAEQFRQRLGSWSQHVCSWVDTAVAFPRLVVRYEDLCADPMGAFRRIVGFLAGAALSPAQEAQVDRAISFSNFAQLQAQEAAHGFRERSAPATHFFRQGQPGAWQQQLTASQVHCIRAAHGAVMARFGYA